MIPEMPSLWSGSAVTWTIVVGLAALAAMVWVAARIRWWRSAQLRRVSLGRPRKTMDGLADGQLVTLIGELNVRGERCARFEDGEPAAACTVTSPKLPEHGGIRQRADGQLRLLLEDGPVVLEGPVEVRVGSQESYPRASLLTLARAVQARIQTVEPSAEAVLERSPLVFRSLAAGGVVRARGVLRQIEPDDGRDYREPGLIWALTPQAPAPALALACDGLPRSTGVLGATVRGIRHRASLYWLVAWLGLIGLALVAAALTAERGPQRTGSAASAAPSGVKRLTWQACELLKQDYQAARNEARRCSRDEQCTAELRGGFWLALDGCYRFVNPDSPALARADRVADAWLEGLCASDYEVCTVLPPTMCREGSCVEQPPDSVPPSWRRHQLGYVLSFFLPPDLERQHVQGEDSLVRSWRSDRMDVVLDYGQWSNSLDDEPNRRAIEVDGRPAILASADKPFTDVVHGRRDPFVSVYVPEAPPCHLVRCGLVGTNPSMNLWIDCTTPQACQDAMTIVRSVTFW